MQYYYVKPSLTPGWYEVTDGKRVVLSCNDRHTAVVKAEYYNSLKQDDITREYLDVCKILILHIRNIATLDLFSHRLELSVPNDEYESVLNLINSLSYANIELIPHPVGLILEHLNGVKYSSFAVSVIPK